MTDLILPRRQFLKAAACIIAAPAVVRFESLMKMAAPGLDPLDLFSALELRKQELIERLVKPPIIRWRGDFYTVYCSMPLQDLPAFPALPQVRSRPIG